MGAAPQATYDLAAIQGDVREDRFFIRGSALDGAFALGFDRYDIKDCILQLDEADFVKTMPAVKMPGLMQDVYKGSYLGQRIYVKLQRDRVGTAIVVQFKEE